METYKKINHRTIAEKLDSIIFSLSTLFPASFYDRVELHDAIEQLKEIVNEVSDLGGK